MAFNIMDMITDQLTPDNIKAVAGMLGDDESKVSSAVTGAVPAILGGLLGSVSKPEGKEVFAQQLEQADDGLMGNLAGMLGGGGGADLVSSGGKMLGALLGDNKLSGLVSALSGSSGLSSASTTSLLGLATPVVMGMLKGKSKSDGLDVGGMVNMLMGQKDNIAKAVPADLGDALSASGLLDGVLGQAGATVGAAADSVANTTAQAARATASAAEDAAEAGGSMIGKLIPIILILLACWFAYQFFMKPDSNAGSSSAVSVTSIANGLQDTLNTAVQTLGGIDSAESARAALPDLQNADRALDKIVAAASNLSSAEARNLGEAVQTIMPQLQRAGDRARAIPGAGDLIGDTMDSMAGKLKTLAEG